MDGRRWARSSRLMKPGSGIISARWFVGRSRRPSTRCWTRKRIGFAVRDVMNALKAGRITFADSVVAAGGRARVKIFIHGLIELSLALTGYGLFLRRFDC